MSQHIVIPESSARPRLDWVDTARAIAVVAIVLFHVTLWCYLPVEKDVWGPAADFWTQTNRYIGGFRLPVLLALSGMLASRRVLRGTRAEVAVSSAQNYYLYVLWLTVFALFYLLVPDPGLPDRIPSVLEYVRQWALPETILWYVFALAVYIPAMYVVRRVPPWVILTLLAAILLLTKFVTIGSGTWVRVPQLAFFFALGVYFAPALKTFASRVTVPIALGVAIISFAVLIGSDFLTDPNWDAIVFIPRAAAFVLAGIAAAAVLIRLPGIPRLGRYIGQRTLAIYIVHMLVIQAVLVFTGGIGHPLLTMIARTPVLAVMYPAILTAVVVGVTLVVRAGVMRTGAVYLFEMPPSLTRSVKRLFKGRAQP